MARYLVVNPWFGVEKGQELELDALHPALASHVKLIEEKPEPPKLEVSTPKRKAKEQ